MTMNIKELTIIVAALAKPRGFKRKGTMFYATGTETTAMLHLQKSRWDSGVYVNTGVLPNAMCVLETQMLMKRLSHWPFFGTSDP